MRSSTKVIFAQDVNGLSEKKYDSSFRNPVSDKNQLLPLGNGNIRRSSNLGLGLILPPPFSLRLLQDHRTMDFSVPLNVADKVSDLNDLNQWSPVVFQTPETPFLNSMNLDDDISPLLPLPPSLDSVGSLSQRSTSQLLIAESDPLLADDMDQILTQDITSVVLNDDLFVQEDVETILSSPVPETPTTDIAEYGMSLCYRLDNAASVGEPYPQTRVNNTTKDPNKASLLCDNIGLPIILSAIPIYYEKSRDDNFGPSTPPRDGTRIRSLSSHAIARSSVHCGHRRSHRIRQPIETNPPSMTPSPTDSPKLYHLPIHRKEGDCDAQSPKGLSLEPLRVVSVAPSSHQPSALCAQLPNRRANVHEPIRTRYSPWNSPIFRSPLSALGCQVEALSQQTSQSDKVVDV